MKSITIFSVGFFLSDKQNLCLKAALKFNHNLCALALIISGQLSSALFKSCVPSV